MKRSIERLIPRKLEVPEGTSHLVISVNRKENLEKLKYFLIIEGKLRGLRFRRVLFGDRKVDLIINKNEEAHLREVLENIEWIKIHNK